MHWNIAAPFFSPKGCKWIDSFVSSTNHEFSKTINEKRIQGLSWHDRASPETPLDEWRGYWVQGSTQWRSGADGYITVFPQLALMAGVRKRLFRSSKPVVAWCFNVGKTYDGWRGAAARQCLQTVDLFVVHSTAECQAINSWLKIPERRVRFVPLQRGKIDIDEPEETDDPFLLALGSAHRDFESLLAAVGNLGYRTIIVAARHAIGNRPLPPNVEVLSGLSHTECLRLAKRARINVVPLLPNDTAAGQVTIVEALRMGRAVVATEVVGSQDYINSGKNAIAVKPRDSTALARALEQVWSDPGLRQQLCISAYRHAESNFSDEVAGRHLQTILDEFK